MMEDSIALQVECPDCQAGIGEACLDEWAVDDEQRMVRNSAHQNRYFVQAGGVIEPRVEVKPTHWTDSIDAACSELVDLGASFEMTSCDDWPRTEEKIAEIKEWIKERTKG